MAANTFEEKSDKTFESAELLVSNNHKSSSIHSYYYSCYQLLNHFLIVHCRYSENEIRDLAKDKESHSKMTNLVKTKLDENGINYFHIFGQLATLKKQRVDADYGMAFVTKTDDIRNKTINFREKFKILIDEI